MKVFFSIICVALSLHISAGFSCLPTGIQRYPDWLMESCERFILCVDGVLHQMQCPYGLFFSPDQELCVSPHEANCNIEEPLCPFWWADPNERIYLGDGQDCGRFYQCHNGVPVGGSCSEGLVFDRNTNSCSPTATCERPRWSCRLTPNSRHPDDSDCSRFFHCQDGVQFSGRCPDDMLFDSILGRCVAPQFATCGMFTTTVAPTTTTRGTPGTITTPTTVTVTSTIPTPPVSPITQWPL